MAFTIRIILRAVRLRTLSSAYFSQLLPLSTTWQKSQFTPREAEKNPMVSMNSFSGMPLNNRMFLWTSSAISGLWGGFCAGFWIGFWTGAAWPPTKATPRRETTVGPMRTRTVRDRCRHLDAGFMLPPFLVVGEDCANVP